MDKQVPLLSVILPVYNAAPYLAKALESIRDQAYPRLEIVAVDDGSQDRSSEILRSFPQVRSFRQSNQGPAAARNLAISEAKGEILAFLDADDLWPRGRLKALMKVLHEGPNVEMAIGRMQLIGPNDEMLSEPTEIFTLGCALMWAKFFARVGPFNPELRRGEDTDWFVKARECGVAISKIPDTVLWYRRHAQSLTKDLRQSEAALLQVAKRHLDRERGLR